MWKTSFFLSLHTKTRFLVDLISPIVSFRSPPYVRKMGFRTGSGGEVSEIPPQGWVRKGKPTRWGMLAWHRSEDSHVPKRWHRDFRLQKQEGLCPSRMIFDR
ncbi:hypothetical protein AVEN_233173-1 [Araneus ventricosus]|uniref:Uncharacterized protein n=1 Tax=Araneus ventricosus TaxID=182803 RepID=A0A4Y2EHK6_ARAVE|nr:hypothetical protein AVEN_233173-1 [Araneus ventricosus]